METQTLSVFKTKFVPSSPSPKQPVLLSARFFEVCGADVLLVERDHVTPIDQMQNQNNVLGSRDLSRPVKRLPQKRQKKRALRFLF